MRHGEIVIKEVANDNADGFIPPGMCMIQSFIYDLALAISMCARSDDSCLICMVNEGQE